MNAVNLLARALKQLCEYNWTTSAHCLCNHFPREFSDVTTQDFGNQKNTEEKAMKKNYLYVLQNLRRQFQDGLAAIGVNRKSNEACRGLVGSELPAHFDSTVGGLEKRHSATGYSECTGEHDAE